MALGRKSEAGDTGLAIGHPGRLGQRKASPQPPAPFLQRAPQGGRAGLKGKEIPGLSGGNKERLVLIWREGAHGGFCQGWYELGGPKGLERITWAV